MYCTYYSIVARIHRYFKSPENQINQWLQLKTNNRTAQCWERSKTFAFERIAPTNGQSGDKNRKHSFEVCVTIISGYILAKGQFYYINRLSLVLTLLLLMSTLFRMLTDKWRCSTDCCKRNTVGAHWVVIYYELFQLLD